MIRQILNKMVLTAALALSLLTANEVGAQVQNNFQHARQVIRQNAACMPNLGEDFEVLDPNFGNGSSYNCIAWTIGITSHGVWPGYTVAHFDQLYGNHGYQRLPAMDMSLVAGVDKIVLYGKANGFGCEATHGSLQMKDGTWSSKLGQFPLIRHRTPYSVSGPLYGQPIAVYARANGGWQPVLAKTGNARPTQPTGVADPNAPRLLGKGNRKTPKLSSQVPAESFNNVPVQEDQEVAQVIPENTPPVEVEEKAPATSPANPPVVEKTSSTWLVKKAQPSADPWASAMPQSRQSIGFNAQAAVRNLDPYAAAMTGSNRPLAAFPR